MTTKEKGPWILLWDQVQKHYGDIKQKETTAQFIERMSTKFQLTIKLKSKSDVLNIEHLNNEEI